MSEPRSATTRSVRVVATIAIAVVLSLVSTVSFAAWTAGTSTTSTAANGTVGISSTGLAGLATTYSATSLVKVAPVRVNNTGTVPLTLSSVSVANGGTLGPNVALAIWPAPAGGCPTVIPAGAFTTTFTTTTTATPIASSFALGVPTTGVDLCIATKLTYNGTLGGSSMTPTLTLAASIGNWTAADTSSTRTMTQAVALEAPTLPTCSDALTDREFATIAWTASPGATGYRVYVRGVLAGTTTGTQFTLVDGLYGPKEKSVLVTVQATTATATSVASAPTPIDVGSAHLRVNCARA